MTTSEFVEWAVAVIGAVGRVVANVVAGHTVPIDGASEIRALIGGLDANDASADKTLDDKFDKG